MFLTLYKADYLAVIYKVLEYNLSLIYLYYSLQIMVCTWNTVVLCAAALKWGTYLRTTVVLYLI